MAEQQNVLCRLPSELRRCILSSMPDLQSLASTALTCRAFYYIFDDNKDGIIRDVLINSIGSEVLPEAIITHRCSPPLLSLNISPKSVFWNTISPKGKAWQYRYVSTFLGTLERPPITSTTWTMCEALELERFHVQTVYPLAQRFIKSCAKLSPPRVIEISLSSRPTSRLEEERIMRALYRFEVFRKLFGRFRWRVRDSTVSTTLTNLFFSKFAPWENAQLACIHDFLAREVMPAFNDIAEHDITWGASSISHYAIPGTGRIQHILSLGLERILEIALCNVYADRERLLKVDGRSPGVNYDFLYEALWRTCYPDPTHGHHKDLVESNPFYTDGDQGAERIWRLGSM
ncbi:hypothetical protein MGN70_006037 [Eutypa lata]|nr:hypothetical protein MGN70_006037 [Eutypa lata]